MVIPRAQLPLKTPVQTSPGYRRQAEMEGYIQPPKVREMRHEIDVIQVHRAEK